MYKKNELQVSNKDGITIEHDTVYIKKPSIMPYDREMIG